MKLRMIPGGVTAASGFRASSCAAGIKYRDRQDMAMIVSSVPCAASRQVLMVSAALLSKVEAK